MNDEDDLVGVIKTVLDEQYDTTLLFCNSQTSLLNATTASLTPTPKEKRQYHDVLEDYSTSLRRVQDHWQRLQDLGQQLDNVDRLRRVAVVYHDHVARTDRVLRTVQQAGGGVWSTYGISLVPNDSETVTVGLATLRASIDSVLLVLKPYLKKD